MALNIDLVDGFELLNSDSIPQKLSSTLKMQQDSPTSPIDSENESSSGISSLDSDDLKVSFHNFHYNCIHFQPATCINHY
jgi:hypothetical protein